MKIVITKGKCWYKDRVGEVFNVMERNGSGQLPLDDFYYVDHPKNDKSTTFLVSKENCVVLKTEPAAGLDTLDLIANLARRVSELERGLSNGKSPIVNTPKPTRDSIVKRAIEDVAKLTSESSYGKFEVMNVLDGIPEPFDPDLDEVVFNVNRDKRTVVALIRYKEEKTVWARGIAKCAPGDVFNAHIGKAIALRRALGLEVPVEYMNAPQPEEPRSGDVIHDEYYDMSGKVYAINPEYRTYGFDAGYHFGKEEGWLTYIDPEDYERRIRQENAKIIDDTESTERAAQEAAANVRH